MAVCGRRSIAENSLRPFWAVVLWICADLEAEIDLCLGSVDLPDSTVHSEIHGSKAGVS